MNTNLPNDGYIQGDKHLLPLRVFYEDTDFTGVVYHANYLKFFERGRSCFLKCIGMSHDALANNPEPLAFAVARMEIDFKRPAKIEDVLIVETRFMGNKGARLIFDQSVMRDNVVLCQAKVTIVQINMDGHLVRPKQELLSQWNKYQFAE